MGTSSVIMALPSEGGTAEMVINDFYDCGNYQGHFDFDTFSVDIKYTKTKRYHITVKAQPNWLNNMAQIERDIEIFGEGFFTLHLTLVEKFKVEDELTINPKAEHYIFGIDWANNPDTCKTDCVNVYVDKCGYYHYTTTEPSTIKAYAGNKCVGILNIE
jgi:hypothetical protein